MTAFEEGVLAYSDSKELIDNPYRKLADFAQSAAEWQNGFQQAERDDPFKPEDQLDGDEDDLEAED